MSDDEFVDSVIEIIIDDILKETETQIGDRDWWFCKIRDQFGDAIRSSMYEYEGIYGSREKYLDVILINKLFGG